MADLHKEYDYLMQLLDVGNIDALEDAHEIIDDFPSGVDSFLRRTWISNAIDCGSFEAVTWILSKNVDLNFRDDEGYTALLSAIDRERPHKYEIIQLLIAHGAPLNKQGINDYTPLHLAAIREDIEAMALLIKNGADLSIRTEIDEYATPLEEARILKKAKSVAYLESVGE